MTTNHDLRDVFICHASEDKATVASPLVARLKHEGFKVWYDEAEICWGESITEKVNWGLRNSRYVIVVLSPDFARKNWPNRELNAVMNVEATNGKTKILPLLVGDKKELAQTLEQYPLLNDKKFLHWDALTPQELVFEFARLIGSQRTDMLRALATKRLPPVAANLSCIGQLISYSDSSSRGYVVSGRGLAHAGTPVDSPESEETLRHMTALTALIDQYYKLKPKLLFVQLDYSAVSNERIMRLFTELLRFRSVDSSIITIMIPELNALEFERLGGHEIIAKAGGFRLGLDDFGAGYSSLSTLRRLPISDIQVSQMFTLGLTDGNIEDLSILRSIGAICTALQVRSTLPLNPALAKTANAGGLQYDYCLLPP